MLGLLDQRTSMRFDRSGSWSGRFQMLLDVYEHRVPIPELTRPDPLEEIGEVWSWLRVLWQRLLMCLP
jgi:hypothetical protein